MSTPITNLVKRWNRGTIDHDKVLIVYDSSDTTGDDTQLAIATAYKNAWGLSQDLYDIDLTNASSRNTTAMWSSWMNALATYCDSNGIEAICAPTTFGKRDGETYGTFSMGASLGSISAVKVLGAVRMYKRFIDAHPTATELDELDQTSVGNMVAWALSDATLDSSGNLTTAERDARWAAGDCFGSDNSSNTQFSKYAGMYGVGSAAVNDDVLAIEEVSYRGVDFSSFLPASESLFTYEEKQRAESCYPVDRHYETLRANNLFMPCWRIGYDHNQSDAPAFTAADCTAMVARSKASKQPLATHTSKKVLNVANCRTAAASPILLASHHAVMDAMCQDLGFSTHFAYVSAGNIVAQLGDIDSQTGLTGYATGDADYVVKTGQTAGSGDTYREYSSGHQLFAQNSFTFPITDALLVCGTTLTNQNYSVWNEMYSSGGDQAVSLSTGAIASDHSSEGSGHSAAIIRNGGVACLASISEPNADEDMNNGTAFFTKLLRGLTAAEAAYALNGEQMQFYELQGDGLAQPFYLQSTVNDMIVYKAQEPIYYSKSSNNERGRGFADDGLDWMGTDYRVEIPDSSGVTQVVIAGYQESYNGMTSAEDFRIIIDQTASPSIDATTTPDWPSWLVATYECIAGTYTFDGDTVWDTKTIVTAANGRKYATFAVDPGAHYFQQQLDPATTGVESWAETTGFTSDAADTGVTYTISGTPTDNGTDVKIVYNDTAKHGPFLLEDTALNAITVEFPTVSMGKAATTTFVTAASDVIVITDPVTVTYSNTDITSGGGGSTRIIDHNIIG